MTEMRILTLPHNAKPEVGDTVLVSDEFFRPHEAIYLEKPSDVSRVLFSIDRLNQSYQIVHRTGYDAVIHTNKKTNKALLLDIKQETEALIDEATNSFNKITGVHSKNPFTHTGYILACREVLDLIDKRIKG